MVMCGEVDIYGYTCMRDRVCHILHVMVFQEHEAGHSDVEGVLSEEEHHKNLAYGGNKEGSEVRIEGAAWKGDMLGEVWVCVAAMKDEGEIDL